MTVTLTVMGGKHNGRQIPVHVPEFRIGRDQRCHLRPNSPDVSRFHCAIIQRPKGVFIKDYGSKNGTLVNHRLLQGGELQLQDGDIIEVGPLAFIVSIVGVAEPVGSTVVPGEQTEESEILEVGDAMGEPGAGDTVMMQVALGATADVQRPPDAGPVWAYE